MPTNFNNTTPAAGSGRTNIQFATDGSGNVSANIATPVGFANPMTTAGDIIIGGTSGAPTRLAIGTSGQVPTVSGGTLVYQTPASSGSGVLGTSKVPTAQSTSSATFVDLSTPDSVTFTLSSPGSVIVQFSAILQISSTQSVADTINIDGTNITDGGLSGSSTTSSDWGCQSIIGGYIYNASWTYVTASLSSGSHTIKVQHRAFGNTGTWANRTLIVWH